MLHRVFDIVAGLALVYTLCSLAARVVYAIERPEPELKKGLRRG